MYAMSYTILSVYHTSMKLDTSSISGQTEPAWQVDTWLRYVEELTKRILP